MRDLFGENILDILINKVLVALNIVRVALLECGLKPFEGFERLGIRHRPHLLAQKVDLLESQLGLTEAAEIVRRDLLLLHKFKFGLKFLHFFLKLSESLRGELNYGTHTGLFQVSLLEIGLRWLKKILGCLQITEVFVSCAP